MGHPTKHDHIRRFSLFEKLVVVYYQFHISLKVEIFVLSAYFQNFCSINFHFIVDTLKVYSLFVKGPPISIISCYVYFINLYGTDHMF